MAHQLGIETWAVTFKYVNDKGFIRTSQIVITGAKDAEAANKAASEKLATMREFQQPKLTGVKPY